MDMLECAQARGHLSAQWVASAAFGMSPTLPGVGMYYLGGGSWNALPLVGWATCNRRLSKPDYRSIGGHVKRIETETTGFTNSHLPG